ncbi:MAG: MurR/RpiR family transcriptional regulator [Lachnospiraceae bacterium]
MGNSVSESISMNYKELFSAEKKVADCILENLQDTIMLNISELAQKSGTSEATVVRMCKHVGYQGYYQMRLLLSRDVGKTDRASDDNETMSSSQRLFEMAASRIVALGEMIEMETLVKAAQLLRNSRMVFVVGAGNTSPVAMDLGFRLERCGIACSYGMIPEHFLNHVSLGKKEDTIIIISRSGASKQVVQAMELARRIGMSAIVITGSTSTQFTEYADCIVRVTDKGMGTTTSAEPDSHLCEVAVSDALLYVLRHLGVLTENKEQLLNYSEDGDEVELLLSEYKL